MKILIISDAWHPQVNGVVRTYEHIGTALEARGHTVKVIGPADFPRAVPMPGYSEIKLALFPYGRLKTMIKHFQPDTIHIATEGPLGWVARRYCKRRGIGFTSSYHTQFPDYVAKRFAAVAPFLYKPAHALTRHVIKRFHSAADAVMVSTPSLGRTLKAWGFTAKLCSLSRGVDMDVFYPGPKTLFQDLKGPVALYVGRVAIEKNIEAFLDMDWPGTKVIVGDGPSRDSLSRRYPAAHFVGIKTGAALAAHYRSADLFVFPSRTDTFGIVLIEALASGIPVAAYNVTGPQDIITEEYLGALHEDDLAKAARAAMKCGTPAQRRAHAETHYTWDKAARQFEDALTATRRIEAADHNLKVT